MALQVGQDPERLHTATSSLSPIARDPLSSVTQQDHILLHKFPTSTWIIPQVAETVRFESLLLQRRRASDGWAPTERLQVVDDK